MRPIASNLSYCETTGVQIMAKREIKLLCASEIGERTAVDLWI